MTKSLYRRLTAAGAALILSASSVFPAGAAAWSGHLESVSENRIAGWALDEDALDSPAVVELKLAGEKGPGDYSIITLTAGKVRPDLKKVFDSTNHGFSCSVNWDEYEGNTFMVTASVVSGEERIPLSGSFTYKKGDIDGTPADKEEDPLTETMFAKSTVIGEGGPGYESASSVHSPSLKADEPDSSDDSQRTEGTASGTEAQTRGDCLGSFIASGYCSCSKCSGGHNLTYSGTVPQSDHTIAADLHRFPLGTRLMIGDVIYTVEDMGSGIEADRIDIFFDTHEEALAFGLQTVEVYSVK